MSKADNLEALKRRVQYRKALEQAEKNYHERINREKRLHKKQFEQLVRSQNKRDIGRLEAQEERANLRSEHRQRLKELREEYHAEKAALEKAQTAPPKLPASFEPVSPEKEAAIQKAVASHKNDLSRKKELEAYKGRNIFSLSSEEWEKIAANPFITRSRDIPTSGAAANLEDSYHLVHRMKTTPWAEKDQGKVFASAKAEAIKQGMYTERLEAAPVVIPPKLPASFEPVSPEKEAAIQKAVAEHGGLPMAEITDEKFSEPLPVGEVVGSSMQKKLHWPTSHIPTPPQGFEPSMMDLSNWDNLAKKLTPKIGHKAAYDVANFVKDYSAKPVHVANRAAERFAETHGTPTTPEAGDKFNAVIQEVKSQTDELKKIHADLLKSGYGEKTSPPAKTEPHAPPTRKANVVEKRKTTPDEDVVTPAGVPPMPPKPPAPPAASPPPGQPDNNPDRGYPYANMELPGRRKATEDAEQAAEADVSESFARKGIARNIAQADKRESKEQEREEKRRQAVAEKEATKHEKLKEELREKARAAREAHAEKSLGRQLLTQMGVGNEGVDALKMFMPGKLSRINAMGSMLNKATGGRIGAALGGIVGGGGGMGAGLGGALSLIGGPVGIAVAGIATAGFAALEFGKRLHEAIKEQIEWNRKFAEASPLMARVFGLMEVEQFRLRLDMGNRLADSAEGLVKSFTELQKGSRELNILWGRLKNNLFTVVNNAATAIIRPFDAMARRFNEILDELQGGARGREGNLFIDLLQNEAQRVFNQQIAGPMPG